MARVMTEQDRAMIQALAHVVAVDRIQRALMGPANEKGRQRFFYEGDPTPAEVKWRELQEQFATGLLTWKDIIAPTQEGADEDASMPEDAKP